MIIYIQIKGLTNIFFRVLNNINLVLSRFNESIFVLSQVEIFSNSVFSIVEIVHKSFPKKNILVSSANNTNFTIFEDIFKSLNKYITKTIKGQELNLVGHHKKLTYDMKNIHN